MVEGGGCCIPEVVCSFSVGLRIILKREFYDCKCVVVI